MTGLPSSVMAFDWSLRALSSCHLAAVEEEEDRKTCWVLTPHLELRRTTGHGVDAVAGGCVD